MREEKLTLEGIVERVVYQNEDNGFTVLQLRDKGARGVLTAVGEMPNVRAGQDVVLTGRWDTHKKFGTQFRVADYQVPVPGTVEGIERYLSSGLIRGIGPVFARKIVKKFGADTIRIIEQEPHRLMEVDGVGEKKMQLVVTGWREHMEIKNVMLFLQSIGVGTGLALRIYRHYGQDAVKKVKENPYDLASEVFGIGFKLADKVAEGLGVEKDAEPRIQAGLVYLLSHGAEEGHTFLPKVELFKRAQSLLAVENERLSFSLAGLEGAKRVVVEKDRVYLPAFYTCEHTVAKKIANILSQPAELLSSKPKASFAPLESEFSIEFACEQKEAVAYAEKYPVMILTGGPGTGKTTTVLGILREFRRLGKKVFLTAPTGRAAKRLSDAAGKEAKTLHRLLEYSPKANAFLRNERNPLSCDAVVVDESSMVDVVLMHHLMKALVPRAHLVLVGDADQLPSVGPGQVFRDLLDSNRIPAIRLNKVFRQAEKSPVVSNAHRMLRGEFPYFDSKEFVLVQQKVAEDVALSTVKLFSEILPKQFRYDPFSEVQVLCPLYRGVVGVENLNQKLRAAVLPELQMVEGCAFGVGDKVMQVKNNYDKGVFNGDIGRVTRVDPEEQNVAVHFEENTVMYSFDETDQLQLAYCVSVHKSQGSEFKVVILPIVMAHYIMLQRNLIYTAITRAKERVFLVGEKQALFVGIKNDKVKDRYTGLREMLNKMKDEAVDEVNKPHPNQTFEKG